MSRRDFLQGASAAAFSGLLGACAPPAPRSPAARARIRAVCFDLFTLFDPRSVVDVARSLIPDAVEFCNEWRSRQFQYCFLRAASGQYADFRKVTEDALLYASRARQVSLSSADQARLVDAYTELTPWPDTADSLKGMREAGLRLATLANYTPAMIATLLSRARLEHYFDLQISTDMARTFKPHPRAYALGPAMLHLPQEQVAFSAFGGWDAAGAKWFGLPTFWVNRLGVPMEELVTPDGTGSTLVELASFVARWGTESAAFRG